MKLRLLNCLSLFTIVFAICAAAAQAQRPGPIGANLPKPNPVLQNEIKRQAAINKILNATVSKVELKIDRMSIELTMAVFQDQRIDLKENGNGAFSLKKRFDKDPVRDSTKTGSKEPQWEKHTFTPDMTTSYKSLLSNGLTAKLDFINRYNQVNFRCDWILTFYFTDGTVVPVYFQDPINLTSVGTNNYGGGDVHLSKTIPGSAFPDPANPTVPPVVR